MINKTLPISCESYFILIALGALMSSGGLVLLFDYSPGIIPLHLLVITFVGVTLYPALLLIKKLTPPHREKSRIFLISLMLSGIYLWWLVCAIANYVSNLAWSSYFSYQVFTPIVNHASIWAKHNSVYSLIVLVVVIAFLLIIHVLHYHFASSVDSGMDRLQLWLRKKQKRQALYACFGVAIWLAIYSFYHDTFSKNDPGIWLGEPLLGSRAKQSGRQHKADPLMIKKISESIRSNYNFKELDKNATNIIIIMVDSLRADHTPIYGYQRNTTPFLNDLFEQDKIQAARQAFSSCSDSLCGILSTLNSKEYRNIHADNVKLHEVLKEAGYQTHFVLSGEHDWYGLKDLYGVTMDSIIDSGEQSKVLEGDDDIIFEAFDKITLTDRPAFFYFHLMSAHSTGKKHDKYNQYQPFEIEYSWDKWSTADYDKDTMVNRYDNGILQSDAYIKEIVNYLERSHLLSNSLIVVLSDHGEAMGEHGTYAHSFDLYNESIGIPFLIIDSQNKDYPGMRHALQIDVAPTILDYVGLDIPDSWQGKSLLQQAEERLSFHQTRKNKATFASIYYAEDSTYKYISTGIFKDLHESEQLYNLTFDPNEKNNLVSQNLEVKALISKMKKIYKNRLMESVSDDNE